MSKEIIFNKVGFEITYQELYDILNYITDEFPELIYDIENSDQSSLITPDDNSFIVTFQQEGDIFSVDVLYYIEPKIWKLIGDVNSQLRPYGLYVSDSDFGQSDNHYELVISKIGHKPKPRGIKEDVSANASTAGMGSVLNAGVSSSGSGDVTNTLKTKGQKMGSPSQVSDLRFLKGVKIKRVKDI